PFRRGGGWRFPGGIGGDRRDRAEGGEELEGAVERAILRRLEPWELPDVRSAGGDQGEDRLGEVQAADLGNLVCGTVVVFLGGPEAHADTGRGAPGAARALVGRRAADALDEE